MKYRKQIRESSDDNLRLALKAGYDCHCGKCFNCEVFRLAMARAMGKAKYKIRDVVIQDYETCFPGATGFDALRAVAENGWIVGDNETADAA